MARVYETLMMIDTFDSHFVHRRGQAAQAVRPSALHRAHRPLVESKRQSYVTRAEWVGRQTAQNLDLPVTLDDLVG